MNGHKNRAAYRKRVSQQAQKNVRKRLGRQVSRQPRGGFRGVGAERNAPAHEQREKADLGVEMSECRGGENRSGRYTNEGVNCIPNGIDGWNFISNKLHRE